MSGSNRVLLFILVSVLILPLFPQVFGASQFYVNVFSIILCLLSIPYLSRVYCNDVFILTGVYYSILLFLMCLTAFFGGENTSGLIDLVSTFRPLIIAFHIFAFYLLIQKSDIEELRKLIKVFLVISITLSVGIYLLEFSGSNLIYLLYKRDSRLDLQSAFLSFFGLTYFASYFYSILLLFTLFLWGKENKKIYIYLAILCVYFNFESQSKIGLITSFGSLSIFMIFYLSRLKSILYSIILISVVFFLYMYSHEIITYLNNNFSGLIIRTLYVMITDTSSSGTLNVRLTQITDTLFLINNGSVILGAGFDKGLYLESWIAVYLYRYGYLGVILFLVYYSYLFFNNLYIYYFFKKQGYKVESLLALSCAVWALFIPLSQLSTAMIDSSKALVFSCFIIALSIKMQDLKNQVKDSK
jgi:hypothetical protein